MRRLTIDAPRRHCARSESLPPQACNAGGFANMMVESAAAAQIIDYPASSHDRA
jgi:hypothetical protein